MLGLSGSGNKDDLIQRIIDDERFHPNMIYDWSRNDDLKDICEKMGLSTSGTKSQKWERILFDVNFFDGEYTLIISNEINQDNCEDNDQQKNVLDEINNK